jgi:hypothetical protein
LPALDEPNVETMNLNHEDVTTYFDNLLTSIESCEQRKGTSSKIAKENSSLDD